MLQEDLIYGSGGAHLFQQELIYVSERAHLYSSRPSSMVQTESVYASERPHLWSRRTESRVQQEPICFRRSSPMFQEPIYILGEALIYGLESLSTLQENLIYG